MHYPKEILAIIFIDQIAAKANVPDITLSQTSASMFWTSPCESYSHYAYVCFQLSTQNNNSALAAITVTQAFTWRPRGMDGVEVNSGDENIPVKTYSIKIKNNLFSEINLTVKATLSTLVSTRLSRATFHHGSSRALREQTLLRQVRNIPSTHSLG